MLRLSCVLLLVWASACAPSRGARVASRIVTDGAPEPHEPKAAEASLLAQRKQWWADYARMCGPLGGDPRFWQVQQPPPDQSDVPDRYPWCEWKVAIDGDAVAATPDLPRAEPTLPFVPSHQPTLHLVHCETELMKPHEPDAPLGVSDYVSTSTGVLVGYNSGEFGGELSWFDREGHLKQTIADDNIIRILNTSDGILALAGLAHLTIDTGSVLKLTQLADKWSATRTELPGAPRAARTLPDGSNFVVTTQHLIRLDAGPRVAVLHRGRWRGLYPNSLVRDDDGTFYIGIRHFVVRLQPSGSGYQEDWLVPSGTHVQAEESAG
jgi:hypothetical protein